MTFHDLGPLAFWLCYLLLVVLAAAWMYRSVTR